LKYNSPIFLTDLKQQHNMKKVFSLLLIAAAMFFQTADAQISIKPSPFRPIPKPQQLFSIYGDNITPKTVLTAWRFTPMAGFNLSTKQLMAGMGYGIQWLRYIDSTQKYYTDFSIQAVGWVNGNTSQTINPASFTSLGITVGAFNQLVQVGAAYTPATETTKDHVGVIVNLALPLNN
jgi:hypothetical protein